MTSQTANEDDDMEDEVPELKILTSETIQLAVREIDKSLQRSENTRIKLLKRTGNFFQMIAELIQQNDSRIQSRLMEIMHDLQDMIVGITNLVVSLSDASAHERISRIYETVYNMGAYLENIIIEGYNVCQKQELKFSDIMMDFLYSLMKLSSENGDSWLYSVLISPIVIHLLNAFCSELDQKQRTDWCYDVEDLMIPLAKATFTCGDFYCQHYLVTIFNYWARWAMPGKAVPIINSVFQCVEKDIRKELLRVDDPEPITRNFLNALNTSSKGPRTVIPISCLYMFVCNTEIRPPEHEIRRETDFWVDFSIVSGRLHAYYSIPDGEPLVSLSIRRDQIDSVCLNWVVNDSEVEDLGQDGDTQSTFAKDEKVLFFHIVLSVDFDVVTSDIESLAGKGYRSIYLVFRSGELVEKLMKDMGYSVHECGTMSCQRPPALRRLLAIKHKLSYKESWCPDSQITGLDCTLNETRTSIASIRSAESSFNISGLSAISTPCRAKKCRQPSTPSGTKTNRRPSTPFETKTNRRPCTPLQTKTSNHLSTPFTRSRNDTSADRSVNSFFSFSVSSQEQDENFSPSDSPNLPANLSPNRSSEYCLNASTDASPIVPSNTPANVSVNASPNNQHEAYNMLFNDSPNGPTNGSLKGSINGSPNVSTNDVPNVQTHDAHDVSFNDSPDVPTHNSSNVPTPEVPNMQIPDALNDPTHDASNVSIHDSLNELHTDLPEESTSISPTVVSTNRSPNESVYSFTKGSTPSPSQRLNLKSLEHTLYNSPNLYMNTSTVTNCEDPLPTEARVKYAHLYKHVPFYQRQETPKRLKGSKVKTSMLMMVRNSSPKVTKPLQEPITPPVSEIGSPQHNILNLTVGADLDATNISDEDDTWPRTPELSFGEGSDKDDNNEDQALSLSPVFGYSRTLESRGNAMPTVSEHQAFEKSISAASEHQSFQESISALSEHQSQEKAASEHCSQEKTASKHRSQEKTASEHRSQEKAASKHWSQEKTASKHRSQEKTASKHRSQEKTASEHRSQEKAASKHCSQEKTASEHRSKEKAASEHQTQNKSVSIIFEQQTCDNSFSTVSEQPPSSRKKSTRRRRRMTCYANSFNDWMNKTAEKSKSENYDPYDLLTSSEMDEYRDMLFPKEKTYGARSARKRKESIIHAGIVKKRRTAKATTMNQLFNSLNYKSLGKESDSHSLEFKDVSPRRKNSFFKRRD